LRCLEILLMKQPARSYAVLENLLPRNSLRF
jgi:hypothetical protein